MGPLPPDIISFMSHFAPLFSSRVWPHAQVLLTGALLAPGKRTVSALLRVLGLDQHSDFQTYHRVLNRCVWSSLQGSQILLRLLIDTFVPQGRLVFGLDDTIERRRGDRIRAKGIYRDPLRSSHSHFVKASGLRWLSLMLLAPVPWGDRIWALPFLSVLCPSQRYYQRRGRTHQSLLERPGYAAVAGPLAAPSDLGRRRRSQFFGLCFSRFGPRLGRRDHAAALGCGLV